MDYIIKDGELYHHGILGMKWGVRRFQNKDGSLTTAGKKRMSRKQKKALEKARATRKANIEKAKSVQEQKEAVLKSRSAKQLFDNAHLFDDRELQAAYNRLALERNIKSLAPAEVSKGEEFINKAIKRGNMAADLVKTGSTLYNNVARVFNAFGGSDLPIIKTGDGKDKDKKKKKDNDDDSDNESSSKSSKVKTEKKSAKTEKKKVKTESKTANAEPKKNKTNFFDWVEQETSKFNSGRDEEPEIVGKGNSKGSQARKNQRARRQPEQIIIDMYDTPVPATYGHQQDVIDYVNRYIDQLDRL